MANLTVGPNSTYSTISAALLKANPHDQISLEAGYSGDAATVSVNDISVGGAASSNRIDLTLGAGANVITLLGMAPIDVKDNGGNNTITGNDGANRVTVSSGTDVVHGGNGIDRLLVNYATAVSSVIGTSVNISDGGTHSVTFNGIENFTIDTGAGDDTITAGNGHNTVTTRGGNDTITSGDGHNHVVSGDGDDTVTTGDGGNLIRGGSGNDTMTSGTGDDFLFGGLGNDTMSGGGGNDSLKGSDGDDTISGGAGNDLLVGGVGQNIIHGDTGIDRVSYAGSSLAVNVHLATKVMQAVNAVESDTLQSIENVTGSAFNDTLAGDGKDNILTGGLGADRLSGGGGSDTFQYASVQASTSANFDTIAGFNGALDKFDLWFNVGAMDPQVGAGHLSDASFNADLSNAIGHSRLGAHDAVVFTPDSGSFSGHTFLIVDGNGTAGYQAGHDLVIELANSTNLSDLGAGNFV